MIETHVVTVGLEFADGRQPPGFTCEVIRGTEDECKRILGRMASVSHDHRPVLQACITCGTIEEWERYVQGSDAALMGTFIKFTDPDGQDIWIAPRWITKIRAPIPGRHPGSAHALIVMGQTEQAVRQEVNQVLLMIEATADV